MHSSGRRGTWPRRWAQACGWCTPAPRDSGASRTGRRTVADLQHEFAPLLTDHADLHVEWLVEHGAPEDTLIAAGETASLVVIGRHHRKHGLGPHLGSTARAVMDGASCPVMVVEPG